MIGVATAGVFALSVSGVTLQFEAGGLTLSAGSDEVPAGAWASTGQLSRVIITKALLTASRQTLRTAPSCDLRNIFRRTNALIQVEKFRFIESLFRDVARPSNHGRKARRQPDNCSAIGQREITHATIPALPISIKSSFRVDIYNLALSSKERVRLSVVSLVDRRHLFDKSQVTAKNVKRFTSSSIPCRCNAFEAVRRCLTGSFETPMLFTVLAMQTR
ncbi:hypothetical protein [Bradyrhizobium liaoningense]|uniref:hypothetical protein n=1 Tax=Bradyrhizobium liaoningense TaxID=43992 RepID=UPI001BA8F270|nr:hypothetical protein [Bradyrhizobium liaoningense]MBR1029382.1 hypothetical protein [Bradyrhizobium liaoningense]